MQTDMTQNTSVFENGDLKIDYAAGCAHLNGDELHLTPIEYSFSYYYQEMSEEC